MITTRNNKNNLEKSARKRVRRFIAPFALLGCLTFAACQPDARILNSKRGESNVEAKTETDSSPGFDNFEKDLQAMRTADFDYIFAFRRKDRAVLNGGDKKFLKANSPAATNRFILTDEGKAVIAGSKFKFAPVNIQALESYFNVENYSKPNSEVSSETNIKAKTNSIK